MKRGLRANAGLYDDWAGVPIEGQDKEPTLNLKDYEIVDVINIYMESDKGEIINCWNNPKYENMKKGEN